MLSESQEKALNSRLSLEVLWVIKQNNQSYGKEISRELEKSQSSISRSLRILKESNIVEKGKRDKAQYYKINYEGLSHLYLNILKEGKESNDSYQEYFVEEINEGDSVEWVSPNVFDPTIPEDEVKKFAKKYYKELFDQIDRIVRANENISLEDFLVKGIYYNMLASKDDIEFYGIFYSMIISLTHYLNFFEPKVDIENILEENFVSLKDMEDEDIR